MDFFMSYEMRITRAATSGTFSLSGPKSPPMLEAQTIMLWIHYSAQIFLLGAEFTKIYASRRGTPIR